MKIFYASIPSGYYPLLRSNIFCDFNHILKRHFLQTIIKLNVLPFRNEEIDVKVNQFSRYSEEIRRNIPDILLATMNILYFQYKDFK